MSPDTLAAFSAEPVKIAPEPTMPIATLGEMALTVLFTLAAVLFVSFLVVLTGFA